ncbi:Putative fumarate reductase [Verticillium dahliae VDG1]|nr:Putative fumarate reductase [Verticillium dahliae VDG1]
MAPRLEKTIGCLLKRARNISSLDDRPFHHGPAFVVHPDPTITIVSSDCGPSPAELHAEYLRNDLFKECGRMPCLSWNCPASIKDEVREWLLIIEDPALHPPPCKVTTR